MPDVHACLQITAVHYIYAGQMAKVLYVLPVLRKNGNNV